MTDKIYLWEIKVPCYYNNGKPVRTKHHQEWDKVVKKIAGGLTIYKPAWGKWVDSKTNIGYDERMIPVQIACTEKQMDQIGQFTLDHYKQIEIMAHVVSEKVKFYKSND
jgi:hypothetical protein